LLVLQKPPVLAHFSRGFGRNFPYLLLSRALEVPAMAAKGYQGQQAILPSRLPGRVSGFLDQKQGLQGEVLSWLWRLRWPVRVGGHVLGGWAVAVAGVASRRQFKLGLKRATTQCRQGGATQCFCLLLLSFLHLYLHLRLYLYLGGFHYTL